MDDSLVSIAIPAYKTKYLANAISSALAQTYSKIEVIVVDDASPEAVDEVVRQFSDSRLTYYRNERNLGRADFVSSWNRCLDLAKGEYFCLLCDDDIYEPDFVMELLSLSKKYPLCKIFRARMKMIDAYGNTTDFYPTCPEFESMEDYIFHKEKELRQQTVSEFMMDASHLRNIGGYVSFPVGWYSDVATCYLMGKENGIVSSPKILASFRQSGINMSTSGKHVIEKIVAINRYSSLIRSLVNESSLLDKRYLDCILFWNDVNKNKLKFEYLRACCCNDFVCLFKRRKEIDISIKTKVFVTALLYRFGYLFLSFLR